MITPDFQGKNRVSEQPGKARIKEDSQKAASGQDPAAREIELVQQKGPIPEQQNPELTGLKPASTKQDRNDEFQPKNNPFDDLAAWISEPRGKNRSDINRKPRPEDAPDCLQIHGASVGSHQCGHRWYVQHPRTRGGPRWHRCGRRAGHETGDRHRCQGCGRSRRVEPSEPDSRQARL